MNHNKVAAVIFDMDGVLIDSEPSWQAAEISVFGQLGLPICLQDTLQTTGLRIDQVVDYWYQRHPWPEYDNRATANAIVQQVAAGILRSGEAMHGAISALQACQDKPLKIGLATSSSSPLIEAVLQKLDIGHYFNAICSAESLTFGKPHPEVYLNCAAALQVPPQSCIAVEDSFNGLIAARAANMHTVVVPASHEAAQAKWAAAHRKLDDLTQLSDYVSQVLRAQ